VHVNLLPRSFIWHRAIHSRLRQWGVFYAVLATALVCWNLPLLQSWTVHQNQLQEIHDATSHIQDMQAQRIKLAKEVVSFEQKIGHLRQVAMKDRTTSILGILAQGVLATERQVQIQEMQVIVSPRLNPSVNESPNRRDLAAGRPRNTNFVSTKTKSASGQSQDNELRMTLRGVSTRSEAITTFVDSLQESKAFPVVELRSTQERLVSDQSVQEFQLECLGYE